MATTKTPYHESYEALDTDPDNIHGQEVIIIERRERIGEVHSSPGGQIPMVVAAFTQAGEYLNNRARDAESAHDSIFDKIEFQYHGITFFAGIGELD